MMPSRPAPTISMQDNLEIGWRCALGGAKNANGHGGKPERESDRAYIRRANLSKVLLVAVPATERSCNIAVIT